MIVSTLKSSDVRHRALFPFVFLESNPSKQVLWPLFIVSFCSLYLELMLIRWIGTEIRIFAYFQNLTLIACFLGFGVGCYRSAEKKRILFEAGSIGLLVLLVGLPFAPWRSVLEILSSALSFSLDAQTWSAIFPKGNSPIGLSLISLLVVSSFLLLIVGSMVPLGQWVGTYLDAASDSVSAYSVNLLGSLAGIWFFAGLSFLRLAPFFWFAVAFILFLFVRPPTERFEPVRVALCGVSLLLLGYSAFWGGQVHWSPYQKLELRPLPHQEFNLLVNNTGYMTLANVSPSYLAANRILAKNYKNSSYDAAFQFVGRRDHVLIVGAGAGNDADAALRNGALHIDAVEIDPVVYSIGKRFHPDHPYDSSRVHVIIEDARSFLRESQNKYDVIIFGLLDSHTEFSGYSNMRIDNYVYTKESLREAKRLLNKSGVLIVKFEVRAPWTWMGQRFYSMFENTFRRPPVVFFASPAGGMLSATEFLASNDSSVWDRAAEPPLASFIQNNPVQFSPDSPKAPPPTTDDWPYVYHVGHTIPRTYLTVSLILLCLAFVSLRRAFRPSKASTWNLFFLGAGFMLLETQMISRLALYFGATWWVNCIALSVLLLVLVGANFLVVLGTGRFLWAWYIALIASLIAVYAINWDRLPLTSAAVGSLLAAGYCLPVFSAGVIFTETFRRSQDKSISFGSNVIGAVAGGLAQNASFVIGIKALLLLAVAFYLLAGLFSLGDALTNPRLERVRGKAASLLSLPNQP